MNYPIIKDLPKSIVLITTDLEGKIIWKETLGGISSNYTPRPIEDDNKWIVIGLAKEDIDGE